MTNLTNIRYLTGVEMTAGTLLLTPRRQMLFVDARYLEAARKIAYPNIEVNDVSQWKNTLTKISRCGFEAETVTVAQLRRWKKAFASTKFFERTEVIEHFRRAKDAAELASFRKSQAVTRLIMKKIPSILEPGITEKHVAAKIRAWADDLGADDLAFDSIVGFGPHTARPHHRPTSRKLRVQDIVQIDCGVKVGGYCSDQSRVFFVGTPKAQWLRALEIVSHAKSLAEACIRAGIENREPDRVAREFFALSGCEDRFLHSLGHGVGLDIHEGVSLSVRAKPTKLLRGEIVTVEPGLYFEGKFGIRLEDEVIVE